LTALAVLAFVVGVVVGAQNANDQVSAATGTIDALNVGACTTNNADVFDKDDHCTQLTAFYQQGELSDLIEVPTVYATYAHDPKTAAENPRAIIDDGDLIRVSISDPGRDRRDPVLITSAQTGFDNTITGDSTADPPTDAGDGDPFIGALPNQTLADGTQATTGVPDAEEVVGEAVGLQEKDFGQLPPLEQNVVFDSDATASDNETTFGTLGSGSYQVRFEFTATAATGTVYKPIADPKQGGVVEFFGRVDDGIAGTTNGDRVEGAGPFRNIGNWVKIDEDVVSGDTDVQPAIKLNVNVPNGGSVALQLIYYETSGIEYIQGGVPCEDAPEDSTADVTKFAQATCTADERKGDNNQSFVLYAESDEDAGGDGTETSHKKNLALIETGRFTGVFQGYLQLTDADGIGGDSRDNWGLAKVSGNIVEGTVSPLEGGISAEELLAGRAVLGVGNGPVTVMYKDSDGEDRSFDIMVDIEPPTIQIDSPVHNERSDDEKPSFIGSFNDTDSGLAADSFQLNVDNRDEEAAQKVMNIDSGVVGSVGPTNQVLRRLDYKGYADADTFGVIEEDVWAMELYKEEETASSTTAAMFKSVEADDFDDGDADGEFNEEAEIDFDEVTGTPADFVFNHAIDFQATVRDLAGNIGFSDSDTANPRFIDDLGKEKVADRKAPNVLGYFSSHVVHIDDLDPVIEKEQSVTGFYGLDDDDIPMRDRSAVMVAFDNDVNGDLIDTGTFTLEFEDETGIAITDVLTDGKLVFLKLGEELASDATPTLSISEGREVEDMAGNILSWQEKAAEAFDVKDGILPVFTLALNGGSGIGIGSEGPNSLTKAAMEISIASDEDINGAPRVAVVCSNIKFNEATSSTDSTLKKNEDKTADAVFDLARYQSNRTGYSADSLRLEMERKCGDMARDLSGATSLSRPENNWIYQWRNPGDASDSHLSDGQLVVVVWGSDRSNYTGHDKSICGADSAGNPQRDGCENWGLATTKFVLDSTFNTPLKADRTGGSVQPEADSKVKEPRPFVLLDFAGERTTVKVTEFKIDGEDAHSSLSAIGDNRFLYWPDDLAFGTHKIEFDARDAADNDLKDQKTSFEFDVTARDPFVLDLSAGWNAISFPADPVDTALDAVFTDEAVDRVIGWNPLSSTGPWSIATRVDGVWSTSMNVAPLTDVVVRYGYWVHSSAFVKQAVDLRGPINRETGDRPDPIGIITVPGEWNFVGVVDQDGDQTENHFGKDLKDSEGVVVNAEDYMPDFIQAYVWDGIANGYRVVGEKSPMVIGKGVWVFFPADNAIAP
jgi:hypothetical protein